MKMNYPAAELRGIKMNFYLINPDAEHRGILSIKTGGLLTKPPVLIRFRTRVFRNIKPFVVGSLRSLIHSNSFRHKI
jgi:hypothetical protein